ncbi:MAG: 3-hydroxyisobutyrate dehydrogenase [Rhodobacteraceae bacterium]|nr:MAG: 3-hydroxyisobutyrate dehydrogenase [Paracoccaceae bacterium]
MTHSNIAFIGFGEASNAIVEGWAGHGPQALRAYDTKLDDDEARGAMLARMQSAGVGTALTNADLVKNADIIFSFVTADQANIAAIQTAKNIAKGALFFDCNSCAPDTKRASAKIINAAGGRYVDVAIMSPVYPKMNKSPLLVSGQYAQDAVQVFKDLDMAPTLIEGDIGIASATKMIRSIMVKGMEALMAEAVLAGCRAGVDVRVLASLDKSFPGFDWADKAAYDLERMMLHGKRRAAEMREVALTIEQLGLPNDMANAIVEWQDRIGNLNLDAGEADYRTRADRVTQKIT